MLLQDRELQAPWVGKSPEDLLGEETPVCVCDECGEGIFEGDAYYDFGDIVCDSCLYMHVNKHYCVYA